MNVVEAITITIFLAVLWVSLFDNKLDGKTRKVLNCLALDWNKAGNFSNLRQEKISEPEGEKLEPEHPLPDRRAAIAHTKGLRA